MTTTTAPTTRRNRAVVVTAVGVCVVAVAGVVTALLLAFGGTGHTHAAAAPQPVPATRPVTPVTPVTPAEPVVPANHTHTVVLPAAQVRTIQQELASLNYYEGPINGVMTPQTVQAITYLQRDAKLPQNGEWNQVTYLAMQQMLATGNNQMAG